MRDSLIGSNVNDRRHRDWNGNNRFPTMTVRYDNIKAVWTIIVSMRCIGIGAVRINSDSTVLRAFATKFKSQRVAISVFCGNHAFVNAVLCSLNWVSRNDGRPIGRAIITAAARTKSDCCPACGQTDTRQKRHRQRRCRGRRIDFGNIKASPGFAVLRPPGNVVTVFEHQVIASVTICDKEILNDYD